MSPWAWLVIELLVPALCIAAAAVTILWAIAEIVKNRAIERRWATRGTPGRDKRQIPWPSPPPRPEEDDHG